MVFFHGYVYVKPDEDSALTTQMSDIFGGKIENGNMYIKRLDNAGGCGFKPKV